MMTPRPGMERVQPDEVKREICFTYLLVSHVSLCQLYVLRKLSTFPRLCVCVHRCTMPYNQLAQHGALFKGERVLNSVPSFLNALTTIGLLMRNLVHVILQTKECSSQVGRCPLVTTFSKHFLPLAHMLCHAVRGLTICTTRFRNF